MNRVVRLCMWAAACAWLVVPPVVAAQAVELPADDRERERTRSVAVVTGYFGVLAPLAHLTDNPETFSTDVSISLGYGGEVDYFLKSGFGFGVLGLYAPAKLTLSPGQLPGAVPTDLGDAKWSTLTANLMYRLDLKGPAGMVEPYALVGGGIRRLNVDPIASPQATDSTDGVLGFGVGAFTLISSHWAIRLDLRGYVSPFTSDENEFTKTQWDTTVLFGISYGFP